MRYFIELTYDGTTFSGWQKQTNAISVQVIIEENLAKILGQTIDIVGCGRTDAGVHAQRYFAHFDFDDTLPDNFIYRINSMIGTAIAIKNCTVVDDEMHARFSAQQRTYHYFMHFEKNPFVENYSYLLQKKPDIKKMQQAMQLLLGTQDFTSFEKKGSDNKTSICTVFNVELDESGTSLVFKITANRFLRNMVRAIVASCLMVAYDLISIEMFEKTLKNKKKMPLKIVVPAKGLFLWDIVY